MARNDIYTMIANATRMNREDVKKVILAYNHSMGAGRQLEVQGGNGGSYVRIEEAANEGMIHLQVGETCVITVNQFISVRALAVILTRAKDVGFEKLIDEYCLSPGGGGVANVPIDQDMPKGERNAQGLWSTQDDFTLIQPEDPVLRKRIRVLAVMEDALAAIAGERSPEGFSKTRQSIAQDALREARRLLKL